MFFNKSIFFLMLLLLSSACSNSLGLSEKITETTTSVNFIIPKSEGHPFEISKSGQSLMSISYGEKNNTVIMKTGSGNFEAVFNENGQLKELFDPVTGIYVKSRWISGSLLLLMYDNENFFR